MVCTMFRRREGVARGSGARPGASGPGGKAPRAAWLVVLVPLLLSTAAAGDDAVPRYVAEQGVDLGDCALAVRPCRTVSYALARAGKGDDVRVAGGTYALADIRDALAIVAGAGAVRGGFDRFDHFVRQAPAANRTTLTGVPLALRGEFEARGFHVIVDRKGIDARTRAALAGVAASRTSSGAARCTDNAAGAYPCNAVDLHAHVATGDLSATPDEVMDVWGFVDLNTEREYALLTHYDGLAVIDVTDPSAPFEVGNLEGAPTGWRDVKVRQRYSAADDRWKAYAYVSAEGPGRLKLVDLTGLPNRVGPARLALTEPGLDWLRRHIVGATAHNVYVSNVDYGTGVPLDEARTPPLLHLAGSGMNNGAVWSFGVSDPRKLRRVASLPGGYSHDLTSMLVTDARASVCKARTGVCEVLVDFNAEEIVLWDFSRQSAPQRLSSTTYAGSGYIHSGWLTEDGRYLYVHDEKDERGGGRDGAAETADVNTTVRVFDLGDLKRPQLVHVWRGPTGAVDHNGFARGNRYYMSTYTRGLTVLDISDPLAPVEVGLFDTHPASDDNYFGGAWGVYPFLPSGTVLVSDRAAGLFVVDDRTRSGHVQVAFASPTFGGEEGDEVSVRVVRSGAGGAVSVDYAVIAGSAGAVDYRAASGTLNWPATKADGAQVRNIPVSLLRDALAEPVERAFVRLLNPGGAVLGDVSLASVFVGDPGRGTSLAFAERRIKVDETSGRVVATVKRLGSPEGNVAVAYEVHPVSASAGSDYRARAGRLSWSDGDATGRTIMVPLVVDDVAEPAERFEIRLSSASGAILDARWSTTVVIQAHGNRSPEVSEENRPPTFAAGRSTARRVAENTTAGTAIGAPVAATDPDGDTLAYTLGGNDAASFALGDGGQLRTRAALDHETKSSYWVTVTAADGEGGTASIEVAITVTDVDEGGNRPPTFPEGASTMRSIAENAAAGTAIGAPVAATDPDGDTLAYALGGNDAASFALGDGGQLRTRAALDYETKSSYWVAVTAADGEGGSASIEVEIGVSDVDENRPPTFSEGTSTTRSVPENATAGTAVGVPVAATDPDGDTLAYVLGGNDAESFALGAGGQLQTRTALDYETKAAYWVTVTAEDGAGGSADIEVAIGVTDVYERPGAPTELTATAKAGVGIELSWTASDQVGDGIVGYLVQRRLDDAGEDFRTIVNTRDVGTTYADAAVTAGATYAYKVQADDGRRRSRGSNVATATAPDDP